MSGDEVYADTLAWAVEFARSIHHGTVDKQGQPFIGHPLRVMAEVAPDADDMCAAILHDTVEDGPAGTLDRIEEWVPWRIYEAVEVLTRRKSESYPAYIRRIQNSGGIARNVKLADLKDNLDARRGPIPDSLRKRYEQALEVLTK